MKKIISFKYKRAILFNMGRIIYIILLIELIISCNYQIDKSNIFSVANAIHYSFVKNDSTILEEIFKDSISDLEKEEIAIIKKFYTKNLVPIKIDTSTQLFFFNKFKHKLIHLFYQKGELFYEIRAIYDQNTVDKNYYIKGLLFYNINKECETYIIEPYNPFLDIDFKRILWYTNSYGDAFKSGIVELQNNTDQDINYIKFQLILCKGNSWPVDTFFKQTVESYKPIYKGDIVRIDIPGLQNYYTGFRIEQDNLIFNTELIEIKPKPESYWCIKLKELKEITSNNEMSMNNAL